MVAHQHIYDQAALDVIEASDHEHGQLLELGGDLWEYCLNLEESPMRCIIVNALNRNETSTINTEYQEYLIQIKSKSV